MQSTLQYMKWPLIVTFLGLLLAAFIGWEFSGTMGGMLSFLLIGIGVAFPYTAYRSVWNLSSHAIHVFWLCYLLAAARLLWQSRRAWSRVSSFRRSA